MPRPFGGMTVFENVFVGAATGGRQRGSAAYDACIDVLERAGSSSSPTAAPRASACSHRKRLELARALATDPSVLLLDEIGARPDRRRGRRAGGDDHASCARSGVAIVWIEHIVHVLVQVVDRLVCMDAGRVIADGEPDGGDARRRASIDAYLGSGRRMSLLERRAARRRATACCRRCASVSLERRARARRVALVGANGAGKTTLLRTIAGRAPTRGRARRVRRRATSPRVPAHRARRAGDRARARGPAAVPRADGRGEPAGRGAARRGPARWTVDTVLEAFPMLAPLRAQRAATLSAASSRRPRSAAR